MRQGVLDEFLTTIFQCNSRRSTSLIIASVRQSLMQRFVPQSIGVNAITREQYVARHVTAFSNTLYNETPEVPVPISYVDGTYTYCHKSTNFRSLRQTFCRHKSQHLVKPALVVAPDGYILDIQGPNQDSYVQEFGRGIEPVTNNSYQQFIHFVPVADEENHPIAGYYCTCRTVARTLGTCVHIASILWYLGYARILRNVHFPSQNLIRLIDDAAERPPQINPL
ncbi:hypothetical protein TKK_0011625 [Trichogramma kaykai]